MGELWQHRTLISGLAGVVGGRGYPEQVSPLTPEGPLPAQSGAADGDVPDHGLPALLRLTAFRRLWLSLGLSSFGDWLGLLAATAMAAGLGAQSSYAAANLAVSGVLILRLAPAVLLGPVAGAFADRFDRKLTMVVGDLLRFVLFASIPMVGTLWWLFVATVLSEIVGLFWMPAKDATIPNIVPRERLEAANQLSLATTYGSAPVAALLFTLLSLGAGVLDDIAPWSGTPADVAMYANALTNLVAAVVVWRLDMPRHPSVGERSGHRDEPGIWRSIVDGWAFVAATPLIRGLVLGMLGAFGAGGFVIGVAPTFAADLGAGSPAYGLLFAAVFTGLATGMWLGPRLLADLARWRLFALAIIASGVCLAGLALIANIVIAVLFTLLLGMAAGIAWVTGYTLLGLEVADDVRGRTFAFVQNSARVVLIGVMALAPGLAALFGERSYRIGQHVLIRYNGAALTLLVASVIAVLIGLISYRTMNDGRSTPLLDDIVSAWRSRPTSTAPEHEITPYPGLFIAFEGGDGAGKTSQITLLDAWLRNDRGLTVVTTREPGATELGSTLRQALLHGGDIDPHAEALLFAADRAQHVHTLIRPALDRGEIVLTDRYIDSSLAYQGAGRGFDPAGIERISRWATGALVPDLTIVLDIDPELAAGRLAETGAAPDRLEGEGHAFHARVRHAFIARARRAPRRYLVLDATQDPLDISEQVRERLLPMLPGARAADSSADAKTVDGARPQGERPGGAIRRRTNPTPASASTSGSARVPASTPGSAASTSGSARVPASTPPPPAQHHSPREGSLVGSAAEVATTPAHRPTPPRAPWHDDDLDDDPWNP